MKLEFLLFIICLFGFGGVIWLIQRIAILIQFYKYLNRLNRLRPEIECIDEEKFHRINSLAETTFNRLKSKYKIPMAVDEPSISDYVRIDETEQKKKSQKSPKNSLNSPDTILSKESKNRSRYFRRRYWR